MTAHPLHAWLSIYITRKTRVLFLNLWPSTSSYEVVDQANLCVSTNITRECKHREPLSFTLQSSLIWIERERDSKGGDGEECKLSFITGSLSAMCKDRVSKWRRVRKNTAASAPMRSLCPLRSRPLLCSLNQACWGHRAHWERKMSKVIRVCVG